MGKLSDNFYFIKKNGTINLGRFSSKYIRNVLEPSGTIAIYYATDNHNLVEQGIPGGIMFFSFNGNNPLYVDKRVLDSDCTVKVNVYKKGGRFVMKIKPVKIEVEANIKGIDECGLAYNLYLEECEYYNEEPLSYNEWLQEEEYEQRQIDLLFMTDDEKYGEEVK